MNKNTISDEEIFILTDKYLRLDDTLGLGDDVFTELDLGCGKGGFTIAIAGRYPERRILAADIMLGRLRRVRRKLVRRRLDQNVKLLRVEAGMLLGRMLPDASIDRLHILCPDPWPKIRHSGRRLLSSQLMTSIRRVMKKGAVFHFATDDPEYMSAVVRLVNESGFFEAAPQEVLADVADIKTEFELEWLSQGKAVPHKAWFAV